MSGMTHEAISTEEVCCQNSDCDNVAYIDTYITYIDELDVYIMDGDEVAEFVDDLPDGWEDGLCSSCVEERDRWCDDCGEVDVSDSYYSTCDVCRPKPEPSNEPRYYDSVRWGNGI